MQKKFLLVFVFSFFLFGCGENIEKSIKNNEKKVQEQNNKIFSCGNKKIEILNYNTAAVADDSIKIFYNEKNIGFLNSKPQQIFINPQCEKNILTINHLSTAPESKSVYKYFFDDKQIEVQNCHLNNGVIENGNWIFFDIKFLDKFFHKKFLKKEEFKIKRKMTINECKEIFENLEKN